MELLKACVILGAGASNAVSGPGAQLLTPKSLPSFPPPLAKDLFDVTANPGYREVLHEYPRAEFLAQLIAPRIRDGAEGVEEILRQLANHDDPVIREAYKFVPPYLRDLLTKVSYGYVTMSNAFNRLVFELVSNQPHEVLFLSLNYDVFLETAITQYNPEWEFENVRDYIDSARTAFVVKIHGSINWFTELPAERIGRFDLVVNSDVTRKPNDGDIIVSDTQLEVKSFQTKSGRWVLSGIDCTSRWKVS